MTVTLPKYSTTPPSVGMVTLFSTCPVAGLAHASVCEPPIQTAPPLTVGIELRPAPAPAPRRTIRVRSATGANQADSVMPTPVVPQTPPEVATRLPAVVVRSVMAEDPS